MPKPKKDKIKVWSFDEIKEWLETAEENISKCRKIKKWIELSDFKTYKANSKKVLIKSIAKSFVLKEQLSEKEEKIKELNEKLDDCAVGWSDDKVNLKQQLQQKDKQHKAKMQKCVEEIDKLKGFFYDNHEFNGEYVKDRIDEAKQKIIKTLKGD